MPDLLALADLVDAAEEIALSRPSLVLRYLARPKRRRWLMWAALRLEADDETPLVPPLLPPASPSR